ncbi:MAG: glycosyltransferase N-terminal domain-containing protein [Myxococcota bacterium]|nr:glycosyltransferase N-terminal domain-containing protein [Myxococcota bacterium]
MITSAYRGLAQALGSLPLNWSPQPQARSSVDLVVHGASAGEVRAASAWTESLQSERPDLRVLITSSTPAGIACGASARLPRDIPMAVDRFFDRTETEGLVLTEADLWPNLLAQAQQRGIPVGVAGARVSPLSARRYRLAPRATREVLVSIAAFAAASAGDAERLCDLGAPADRVEVTGWLKWPRKPALGAALTEPEGDGPLLVLGSVHPGEVKLLARRLEGTPLGPGAARWVAVARHARSGSALGREGDRLLPRGSYAVDSRFGVLDAWYARADAIFVGGGARGRGVHDLLAPLQAGRRPLCFLRRGDPADVGRTLASEGLALPLDGEPALQAEAALEDVTPLWAGVRARHDGRARTTRYLSRAGVLPQ